MTLKPMLKPINELWADALESGEYTQGQGALCKNGEYCCLGVLIDLAIKHGVQIRTELQPTSGRVQYDEHYGFLPHSVAAWAGLQDSRGSFHGGSLFDLNDSGVSFREIAAIIRSKPKGLFHA